MKVKAGWDLANEAPEPRCYAFSKKLLVRGRIAAKTTVKCLSGVMSAYVKVQALLLNAVKKLKMYQSLVPSIAVSTAQTQAVFSWSVHKSKIVRG